MKLHIECLQEKIEQITKEKDAAKREFEIAKLEDKTELEKLGKIVKTLEEELANKAEKIKI